MKASIILARLIPIASIAMASFGLGLPGVARADCQAGNPNANMIESTPTSDFTDNGNGTVTHKVTGLMWKKCVQGLSGAACTGGAAVQLDWATALKAAVSDTT